VKLPTIFGIYIILNENTDIGLKYHNYYVFSTMTSLDGDLVSIVFFCFVILTDDIDKTLNQMKRNLLIQ
jgi:hypothetical protein